jgi:hypothetical protein
MLSVTWLFFHGMLIWSALSATNSWHLMLFLFIQTIQWFMTTATLLVFFVNWSAEFIRISLLLNMWLKVFMSLFDRWNSCMVRISIFQSLIDWFIWFHLWLVVAEPPPHILSETILIFALVCSFFGSDCWLGIGRLSRFWGGLGSCLCVTLKNLWICPCLNGCAGFWLGWVGGGELCPSVFGLLWEGWVAAGWCVCLAVWGFIRLLLVVRWGWV